MKNLLTKNAFVCGSTQGIGRATAIELANQGANITLCARNESKLKAILTELPSIERQKHNYIVADFNKPNDLQLKVLEELKNKKVFHILVNNTGGPAGGPILNAAISEFENALTMHLKSAHLLVQALVPGMKKIGFGRIINIISTSVKSPLPGLGVSNSVRGAMANWAKTLSFELAAFGITVNNILPGFTATPRLDSLIADKAQKAGISETEVKKQMISTIPAGRFGKPQEPAALIGFLSSSHAGYINGVSIQVDGGRTQMH